MDTMETLKSKLTELLDKANDKDLISSLTTVNDLVNKVESETADLKKENTELLKDYKEMIKHTSFKVNEEPTRGVEPEKTLDEIINECLNEIESKK